METLLFVSSRRILFISLVAFFASFFINKLFDNPNPKDLLAPLAQEIAHFLSSGAYYLAIGLFIFGIAKFIYEQLIKDY
ncbi:Uncharacterised protein [Legionella beliardensis]|uniref:Uncharacterized protein n=2 Tax=Legionella beliardensis TaxID=91822 RepID=A0A378JQM9_9GAMM|nr:Uncharacterised protein [Legionella beliardensis]